MNPFQQNRNKNKSTNSSNNKQTIDTTNTELFPELVSTKEPSPTTSTANTFKDILNTIVKVETTPSENDVEPGWIKISRKDGSVIRMSRECMSGEQIKKDDMESILANIHVMDQITNGLRINMETHQNEYDALHGEGEFVNKYRLPCVYPSDDEEDQSEDDDDQSEDNDELEQAI